jgi:hypothetical protein
MRKGKKLLIASVGVAAISYACNKEPPRDPVGNLRGPEPTPDAGTTAPVATPPDAAPGPPQLPYPVGNLRPPTPIDAGKD